MFFYDPYWRTWDRRLIKTSHGVYDISMTPINNDWESVKECRIRLHATRQNSPIIEQLPDEIIVSMITNLGKGFADLLIGYNFVREIGLSRLREFCNGPKNNGGVAYRDMI